MSDPQRILCISFSPIATDARVLRQLRVLAEYGEVTTLGYGDLPPGASHHLQVPDEAASLPQTLLGVVKLALRMHRSVQLTSPGEKSGSALLRGLPPFDLVVANDARALPLAFSVARDAPVWADLHEWAPEENTTNLPWKLLVAPYMDALCRQYLPKTKASTTVNDSIAKLYVQRYDQQMEVVRNAIPYQDLQPGPVDNNRIRLVHSGGAARERNIEALIDTIAALDDRFSLDLYLMGDDDGYLGELKRKAAATDRVYVRPPVSPTALPSTLNNYDLGVYLLPLRTQNHHLMLPNKLFDFVQARLGILMSPARETSAIIAQYGLGPTLADHSVAGLVTALNSLDSSKIALFKQNAHEAARVLNSELDNATMRGIVSRLL